jgi:hypothetical protein
MVLSSVYILQILEPWIGARYFCSFPLGSISSHTRLSTSQPTLQQAMIKIEVYAIAYQEAIDASIKAARDGVNFSTDAIELCDYLIDPTKELTELEKYTKDLQDKSGTACENSTQTLNKFRDVHIGLVEVGMHDICGKGDI